MGDKTREAAWWLKGLLATPVEQMEKWQAALPPGHTDAAALSSAIEEVESCIEELSVPELAPSDDAVFTGSETPPELDLDEADPTDKAWLEALEAIDDRLGDVLPRLKATEPPADDKAFGPRLGALNSLGVVARDVITARGNNLR